MQLGVVLTHLLCEIFRANLVDFIDFSASSWTI